MRKLLTVAELADLLSINQLTVRRMVNRGQLTAVRLGRAVRFHPDDVDAFLATARTHCPPTVSLNDGHQERRKA